MYHNKSEQVFMILLQFIFVPSVLQVESSVGKFRQPALFQTQVGYWSENTRQIIPKLSVQLPLLLNLHSD